MNAITFSQDSTPVRPAAKEKQAPAPWPAWDQWEKSDERAVNRSNDKRYPPGYVYKEGFVVCVSCRKQVKVNQDGRKSIHRGRRAGKANCRGSGKLIRSKKITTNQ